MRAKVDVYWEAGLSTYIRIAEMSYIQVLMF